MQLPNAQQERFCHYVANGYSLTEAARRAGYPASSAHNSGCRLHKRVDVQKRIAELQKIGTGLPASAIGVRTREARLAGIEDRCDRMRRIIAERAADPDMQSVPGGKTGLLVATVKQVGSGKDAQLIREYKLDTGLLSELRMHEELAAEELGQRAADASGLLGKGGDVTINQLTIALRQQMEAIPANEREAFLNAVPEPEREEIILALGDDYQPMLNGCTEKISPTADVSGGIDAE